MKVLSVAQTVHHEEPIPGGRQLALDVQAEGLSVPALLQLPDASGPVPAALLLHGFSNRKEVMADSVGRSLLRLGVASLAIDLPMHGSRGNPLDLQNTRNPLEAVRLWRLALREAALGVRFLRGRQGVDAARVGVVGYSLGSFLAVTLAAAEPDLGPVVLTAGGDLPDSPLTRVARAVVDPPRAVKRLNGRPLLMVNGRHDPVIRPEQAQRLFDAAGEPKELRWWDAAGHALPPAAVDEAAAWLAARLAAIR